MSGTIDKIKAKVDNVLHKDGTSNTGSDPTSPHDSRVGNKADPRVDSNTMGGAGNTGSAGGYSSTGGMTGNTTGTYGTTGSDPSGPHDSRLANKMDPRVDSDRYGSAGNTQGASYNTGTTGGTGFTQTGSDPTGPHDSRLANKADPRVDSDRMGGQGNTGSAGGYSSTGGMTGNTTGTYGSTGNTTGTYGTTGSDPTGPHDSRLGNKADPRVDSNQYGATGNTQGTGGMGGAGGVGGVEGQHHHHGHHHHHHQPGNVGSGNAPKTAGPHNSDLLNKADPRVDSDLDGSKTMGGNQTYQ